MTKLKNRIPAIPTKYKGVRFRSRLEARWAAFFDLVGWGWAYEPLDLRGYIPDFILLFEDHLLVEVKPFMTLEELRSPDLLGKIENSGWDGDAICLGARVFPGKSECWGGTTFEEIDEIGRWGAAGIGIVSQREHEAEEGDEWRWSIGEFSMHIQEDGDCGRWTIAQVLLGWHCYLCGGGWRNPLGFPDYMVHAWTEAGNEVQWKGASDV